MSRRGRGFRGPLGAATGVAPEAVRALLPERLAAVLPMREAATMTAALARLGVAGQGS